MGIPYVLVGSLASSARGVYRATADADLLARLAPWEAVRLTEALGTDWYADRKRAFSLVYIPMAAKIDIFPADSEFHDAQLQRATAVAVFPGEAELLLPVASVEDTVLAKMQWYRAGGETSDRQWRDITGLLATNTTLDLRYMREWGMRLRVHDLLDRALDDVARN